MRISVGRQTSFVVAPSATAVADEINRPYFRRRIHDFQPLVRSLPNPFPFLIALLTKLFRSSIQPAKNYKVQIAQSINSSGAFLVYFGPHNSKLTTPLRSRVWSVGHV